jgi:hypothetical protein
MEVKMVLFDENGLDSFGEFIVLDDDNWWVKRKFEKAFDMVYAARAEFFFKLIPGQTPVESSIKMPGALDRFWEIDRETGVMVDKFTRTDSRPQSPASPQATPPSLNLATSAEAEASRSETTPNLASGLPDVTSASAPDSSAEVVRDLLEDVGSQTEEATWAMFIDMLKQPSPIGEQEAAAKWGQQYNINRGKPKDTESEPRSDSEWFD